MMKKTIAVIASTGMLLLAFSVAAQTTINAQGALQNVASMPSGTINVNDSTNTTANGSMGITATVNGVTGTGVNNSTDSGVTVNVGAALNGQNDSLATQTKSTVGTQVMVNGWNAQNQQAASAFVKAAVASDSNVKAVDMEQNDVQITYAVGAKFLGIFPTTVNVKATADANGNVSVKYPWYTFLLGVQNMSKLQANFNAALQNNQTSSTFLSANQGADAHLASQMNSFNSLSTALKTTAGGSATVNNQNSY